MAGKGRRQRLKREDEFDVVDSNWRRVTGWDRGVVSAIKRRINRRARREAREVLRKEL